MKLLLLLSLWLFLCFQAQAYGPTDKVNYYFRGEKYKAQIFSFKNIQINEICAKNLSSCKALEVLNTPSQTHQLKPLPQGTYSSTYCRILRGVPLVVTSEKTNSQSEFCLFEDLSLINSAQLYQRHKYSSRAKR